jgi:hypothetical protein
VFASDFFGFFVVCFRNRLVTVRGLILICHLISLGSHYLPRITAVQRKDFVQWRKYAIATMTGFSVIFARHWREQAKALIERALGKENRIGPGKRALNSHPQSYWLEILVDMPT